jgi:hypothetical protein
MSVPLTGQLASAPNGGSVLGHCPASLRVQCAGAKNRSVRVIYAGGVTRSGTELRGAWPNRNRFRTVPVPGRGPSLANEESGQVGVHPH